MHPRRGLTVDVPRRETSILNPDAHFKTASDTLAAWFPFSLYAKLCMFGMH